MNKGLLVLEDGRVLSGKTNSTMNILGAACLKGQIADIQNGSESVRFELDVQADRLDGLCGKIVVDSLPLEYHMYDVKSTIL